MKSTSLLAMMLGLLVAGCAAKGEVRDIDQVLKNTQARVQALEEQNNALNNTSTTSFTGMRAAMIELNRQNTELTESNQKLRTDFARMQSSVEDALARTKSQLQEIQDLRTEMAATGQSLKDYDQRYQRTQQSLSDFQAEYARHLRELEKRVEEMEVMVKAMQAEMTKTQ